MSREKSSSFNDDDVPLSPPPPRQPPAGASASPASPPVTPPSTPPVYPVPQPPVVPQKKSSTGCGWFAAALVIVGIILFIAAASHGSSTSVDAPPPTPTPPPPTYNVIWHHSYDSYTYTYNGQPVRPSSGNHFIVVNATVQNLSDSTQSFPLNPTFILYSEGDRQQWAVASFMTATITLQPHYEETLDLIFIVPNDSCGYAFSVSAWGYSGRWTDTGC
jgi:hypothetical protein